MSIVFRCDGCDKELSARADDHVIRGERVNRLAGGGLPDGRFDWCFACARLAFAAVLNARKVAKQ